MTMKLPRFSFVAFPPILFLLCSVAYPKGEMDLARIRKTVEEANQKFIDASLRGDAVAAAALCTDDTILLPPNSPMVQGKKATEEYWLTTWAQLKITDFKMAIANLYGQGNLVYEVGSYSIQFQIQGKEGVDEGKYVVVWKQMADNTWKKNIDIWNSSTPAQ
jgi:ketosteroid isomerase-like protein